MLTCILAAAAFLAIDSEIPVVSPEHLLRVEPNNNVISLSYSQDDRQLFVGYRAGNILKKLPYRNGGAIARWDIFQQKKDAVAYFRFWPSAIIPSSDGSKLYVSFGYCASATIGIRDEVPKYRNSGSVKLLDSNTLEELKSYGTDFGIYGLEISADSSKLAIIGARGTDDIIVELFLAEGFKKIARWEFTGHPAHIIGPGAVHPMEFSNDGKYLLATTVSSGKRKVVQKRPGTTDSVTYQQLPGKLAIIDLANFQEYKLIQLETGPVMHLSLSHDDKWLSYAGCVSRVSLDDNLILKPKVFPFASGGIDFLADNKHLIGINCLGLSKDYIHVLKAGVFSIPLPTASNWTNGTF